MEEVSSAQEALNYIVRESDDEMDFYNNIRDVGEIGIGEAVDLYSEILDNCQADISRLIHEYKIEGSDLEQAARRLEKEEEFDPEVFGG